MSRFTFTTTIASLLIIGLAGCGGADESKPPPASRPVKIFLVAGGSTDAIRTFPGRVDATQRAELAFRVPGQLQEILVREGDMAQEGQVLARPLGKRIALHRGQWIQRHCRLAIVL